MPVSQKLRCVIDQIVAHGDRVYTVTLRPERPVPPFRAGQFLHLALDHYDPTEFWPDSRGFSIASSPRERDAVRITYSVQGQFSERMERELAEGGRVWIKMPYGNFVIDTDRDAVLFAGGTGITAFTAFLEGLPATAHPPVTVAYGARTDQLLIYRHVVERCAERTPPLDAMYFAEAPTGGAAVSVGRVSVGAVWPRLRQPLDANYYISGPPAMLRAIDEDLRARDVSSEAIYIDAWE